MHVSPVRYARLSLDSEAIVKQKITEFQFILIRDTRATSRYHQRIVCRVSL
jgi:hypothetical protein